MAETTNNVAVINNRQVAILRSGNNIKIISLPARTHEITLNTTLINTTSSVSEEEHGLMERILDGLVDGIEDRMDLSQSEIDSLKSIAQKTNTYEVKAVTPVTAIEQKNLTKETISKMHNFVASGEERKVQNILNRTERRIISLKKTVDIYSEDFYQVEYDIPTRLQKLSKAKGGVDNPSAWFWKHAMRLSLSCWCFPTSSFNHEEVKEWMEDARQKGCKVRVIKYAKDQIAIIKEMAVEELRQTMIEYHTGLIQNIQAADERLQEAINSINDKVMEGTMGELSASREERERRDYRNNQVRAHINNAAERLQTAIESAEMFDLTESIKDLFNAYHATLESFTESFNALAKARGVSGVNLRKILKSVA